MLAYSLDMYGSSQLQERMRIIWLNSMLPAPELNSQGHP